MAASDSLAEQLAATDFTDLASTRPDFERHAVTIISDARVPDIAESGSPDSTVDHHLIICRDERIVFHDHFDSAVLRLSTLISLLTAADSFASVIDTTRAAHLNEIYNARVAQWTSTPDEVVNALAKVARTWGIQIYVSSIARPSVVAEPAFAQLFTIITEYTPGQVVAEHFSSREERQQSLTERAMHFFAGNGNIPAIILDDEQRLAALVATFLMPARISLVESEFDASRRRYRPAGQLLPVF